MAAAEGNYRIGSFYALATAALFATQEPFSFLAAERLNSVQFVCVTQLALLASIPLLLARSASRRDFIALLTKGSNLPKLACILAIGMAGLLLYNYGLSNAHPIIISAILNLSPFWAALVARIVSRKPIPLSPLLFFGCLAGGFLGAMAIVWSQGKTGALPPLKDLLNGALQSGWIYAVPIPVFTALNGTLIGKWFREYDESAAIAANFAVSTLALVPTTTLLLLDRSQLPIGHPGAILLMMAGTIIAAAVGRVFYQLSLSATDNDNGFVTMFFLLVPALTSFISLGLSLWIPSLGFSVDVGFIAGIVLNSASLALFSLKSWGRA